jgi:nitrous oxidase accessory protein NosD
MSQHLRAMRNILAAVILCGVVRVANGSVSVYVGIAGTDGPTCGSKQSPCRSIGQGIANAAVGDTVVVGPGLYGDINANGVLGDPGDENPAVFSPGCGCVLGIEKSVDVTSSDGAGATVIDARGIPAIQNVAVLNSNLSFGKPGKGFTVTSTATSHSTGIGVDGSGVTIAGNQVVGPSTGSDTDHGIGTVINDGETILIEGNQVTGWNLGIDARGVGKTVRKNEVARNFLGVADSTGGSAIVGNVLTDNFIALALYGAGTDVVGNAFYGNRFAMQLLSGFTGGSIAKNNFIGNEPIANCAVFNDSGTSVLAANNYWGAASGPGPDPADASCGGSAVTSTPFAIKPFGIKARIKP